MWFGERILTESLLVLVEADWVVVVVPVAVVVLVDAD